MVSHLPLQSSTQTLQGPHSLIVSNPGPLWPQLSLVALACLLCSIHVASLLFLQVSRHSPAHLRACCPLPRMLFPQKSARLAPYRLLNVSFSWGLPWSPFWKLPPAPIPKHVLCPLSLIFILCNTYHHLTCHIVDFTLCWLSIFPY